MLLVQQSTVLAEVGVREEKCRLLRRCKVLVAAHEPTVYSDDRHKLDSLQQWGCVELVPLDVSQCIPHKSVEGYGVV